nr:hypothetical protein [Ruminococcus sp.]
MKAVVNTREAKSINQDASDTIDEAKAELEAQRDLCREALENLGKEKLFILNSSVQSFIQTFQRIKNIDFQASEGLDELNKMPLDKKEFEELKEMGNFALSITKSATVGTLGGALTAFGAYSAASTFAAASTGTAIATLSGAAATNATLAFFGGGSLAAGGLGMAGGTAVLGGLVAGPALCVMGLITDAKAKKDLENAKANQAQSKVICEELHQNALVCEAIRRRCYMFYTLLARLDAYFLPLVYRMEDIVADEGEDYRQYKPESKEAIAACAAAVGSIKAVLDTPLLTEEGNLTEESETVALQIDSTMKWNKRL